MLREFNDRLLKLRISRDEKELKAGFLITGFVIILLFANILYLNFIVIKGNSDKASGSPLPSTQPAQSSPAPSETPAPTQTLQTSNIAPNTTTKNETTYHDYYINLGSGSNQSTDWADVAGTISTFDIAAYKNIKEVRLETNIDVPTANGTVSVRLFNKTGGYAVWNSERTVQSQVHGDLLISEKLNYDYGPKMYQVQMKSQLNVPANLTQSRLHIIAE